MTRDSKQTVKAHCNHCGCDTYHFVLAAREHKEEDEMFQVWTFTKFEMLECCGCQEVRLRRTFASPEMDYRDICYYPPSMSRKLPAWTFCLPSHMMALMPEIYGALHASSWTLAIMGVRTLIDMVIVNEVGDQGNFSEGLRVLKEKGLVSSKNAKFLATAFDAGSAATHRGHRPKISDVNIAMDIAENLLEAVYVLDSAAAKLRESTPPRPSRTKKVATGP